MKVLVLVFLILLVASVIANCWECGYGDQTLKKENSMLKSHNSTLFYDRSIIVSWHYYTTKQEPIPTRFTVGHTAALLRTSYELSFYILLKENKNTCTCV